MMKYRLFSDLADRYDLHTPPSHYQHDHQFVIDIARKCGPTARLLDVGCGTGAFVAKAREAGVDAYGIDSSPEMIVQCNKRLGGEMVQVLGMEELDAHAEYDVVCALSWTLHYAESPAQIEDIIKRVRRALRPGGIMVLQVAHAANATGELLVDREAGPQGDSEDVVLMYRFVSRGDPDVSMLAQYVYLCWSKRELVNEDHVLMLADAKRVAGMAKLCGFSSINLFNSWQNESFNASVSPFLVAR